MATPKHSLHGDLKGPHPSPSSTGTTHLLVAVHNNYIHIEGCNGVDGASMADSYQRALTFFSDRGITNKFLRIDNASSPHLRAILAKRRLNGQPITLEFVPPGMHRANRAEKAIQFVEASYISTIATANPDYPTAHWDKVLPQLELAINHLIPWSLDKNFSAYQGLMGQRYDFNAHPFAPFGVQIAKQIDPNIRGSFGH
jgi:hypothetical protein